MRSYSQRRRRAKSFPIEVTTTWVQEFSVRAQDEIAFQSEPKENAIQSRAGLAHKLQHFGQEILRAPTWHPLDCTPRCATFRRVCHRDFCKQNDGAEPSKGDGPIPSLRL